MDEDSVAYLDALARYYYKQDTSQWSDEEWAVKLVALSKIRKEEAKSWRGLVP